MPRLALFAAGSNSHGQLGIGSQDDAHTFTRCIIDSDQSSASESPRIELAAGANHTVLMINDQLYKAGSSKAGQLGPSSDTLALGFERFDPFEALQQSDRSGQEAPAVKKRQRVLGISAGWETTSILSCNDDKVENTSILSMGSNALGQLGSIKPNGICSHRMLSRADRLVSGPRHTIALHRDGAACAWGASRHGQLGVPDESSTAIFQSDPQSIRTEGSVVVVDAAAGQHHTVLLKQDGTATFHGSNRKGQLGSADLKIKSNTFTTRDIGDMDDVRLISVHATWNSTFMIGQDGAGNHHLISFGNNAAGQLGRDDATSGTADLVRFESNAPYRLLSLATGSEHVLAILEVMTSEGVKEQLYGWGWNEHGNLGQGEAALEDVRLPKRLWSECTGEIIGIFAGNGTSWIALSEDS